MKGLSASVLLCLLFSTASYSQSRFTGTFMADLKLEGVMFLVLTQTQDSVSGALTIVAPDKKEGTRSHTLSLQGHTDGDTITLTTEGPVINGRRQGDNITLMFPSNSGIISTAKFAPSSEAEFNRAVITLHDLLLAAIKVDQEVERQKLQEAEKITSLTKTLANDISAIKATGIKQDIMDINSALDHEHSALHQLENDSTRLQRDASVRPMTCYQAYQTVGYDFHQTLGYDYNQKLGYANNQFQTAANRLEERLSRVESMVEKIKKEAAQLDQAIKVSRYSLPKLKVMPADAATAIAEYQALAHSAHKQLPSFKATNGDIVSKAKEIMQEGKVVMEKAQSLVTCR